jgi:hypothetical protein
MQPAAFFGRQRLVSFGLRQIGSTLAMFSTLLAVLTLGCSDTDALTRRPCVPGVDCDAIYSIEVPPNCHSCADCADNWGSCSPGGAACKRGALDLDEASDGCESALGDVSGQRVMHGVGPTIGLFSFNAGDSLDRVMSLSVAAYDDDEPGCVPAFMHSCPHTLRALQLRIEDFHIPESTWTEGVATLNGPVAASDDGTGIAAQAPMQFAFVVQQGSTRRVALSSAFASLRIVPNQKDEERATVVLLVDSIDFGGYQITDLLLNGELTTAPPP